MVVHNTRPDHENQAILRQQKTIPLIALEKPKDKTNVNPQEEEFQKMRNSFLNKYSDVFSDKLRNKFMSGPDMEIYLKDDVNIKPTHVTTARPVPAHHREAADKLIDEMVDSGIIQEVSEPSDWLSPSFFIEKGCRTKLRFISDFTGLNRHIKRNVHPFKSTSEILKELECNSNYFCVMDALSGYYQIRLSARASQLTTFLIYRGKYRYLVAPQGLCASSDEFLRRSDQLVESIPGVHKLVDDILILGTTLDQLEQRIDKVLTRMREGNMTISKAKFKISQRVSFGGFLLTPNHVEADPDRIKALTALPPPKDVSSLRGYLGAMEQLNLFVPDLSHHLNENRKLLKGGTSFTWTETHQKAYDKSKEILQSRLKLLFYDITKPTFLLSDASYHGLGFALTQESKGSTKEDQKFDLVYCGSRTLKDAELNYSVSEVELLGIQFALKKCRHYVIGNPNLVVFTDHRPLLSVISKPLCEVSSTRLQRLRMKISNYSFEIEYRCGKKHYLADLLSRRPYFFPEDESTMQRKNQICTISLITSIEGLECLSIDPVTPEEDLTKDPQMEALLHAANSDVRYQKLMHIFTSKEDITTVTPDNPAYDYQKIWEEVSKYGPLLIYQDRILIPDSYRQTLLELLHAPCQGQDRTLALARSRYYWPTMSHDIKTFCANCQSCAKFQPSQRQMPLQLEYASRPLQILCSDIFSSDNKKYLVIIDKFSKYPWIYELRSETSETLIKHFKSLFNTMGFYPQVLRTDEGRNYVSHTFRSFLKEYGIILQTSAAHHHQANGESEQAVKKLKYLLQKSGGKMDDEFMRRLNILRQTPLVFQKNNTNISSVDLLFGNRTRGYLPTLPSFYKEIDRQIVIDARHRSHLSRKKSWDKNCLDLSLLRVNQSVLLQHPISGRWTIEATIKEIRPDGHSYMVESDGKLYSRNRKQIRPHGNKQRISKFICFGDPLQVTTHHYDPSIM